MSTKGIFYFIIFTVWVFFCYAAGTILFADWGGNYAVNFTAFGLRGYEATGVIGGGVGFITGIVSSIFWLKRIFKRDLSLNKSKNPPHVD